jgi:cbb3-type cytochrome oxidase maturation protein
MEVILLLIVASLLLAVLFLGVFIWAARSGQFEDTTTPALRVLTDDPLPPSSVNSFPGPSRSNHS